MPLIALLLTTLFAWPPGLGPEDVECRVNVPCTLTAQPVLSSIAVDGQLDEPDWEAAPTATGFKQFEPLEGAPPSQETEVRILYGRTSLYVGALLHDDEADKILRTLGRRDEFNQADWFIVAIDSYFDRKTAYTFAVNAAGVQVDGILTGRLDTSWDAVWRSSARVTEAGWIVEMEIPYSMLRFSEAPSQQWGINFRRIIPRLSETTEWVLVPREELGGGAVANYGILTGLDNIHPRRNVQVTPYTLSRVLTEEGDLGRLQSERSMDLGGDVKIGLSSNVTLDATVNPDFGQVESDPAVLNLSAFETFFPERRPFFTEGVQIFDYNLDRGGELLYTRRIGGRAPIVGATKLSGRTGRGLSFGVLGAATGEHFSPNRYYGVARLQQQIGELSSVGGMLTGYEYRSGGAALRRSTTGGADWDLRFAGNRYKFDGQASFTHRRSPAEDLAPETGFAVSGGFDKIRGIWNVFAGVTVISDDFNPNDVGRLRRNDYMNVSLGFSHQINGGDPFGPFRRASMRLFSGNGFSYSDGTDQGLGFFLFSDWQTHGFQSIDLSFNTDYLLGGYDTFETRGLGPRAQPREARIRASFQTDSRRSWQVEPGFEAQWYDDGGRSYGAGLEGEWNVSSRVSLSAEVGAEQDRGVTAWASNEAFAPLEAGWGIAEDSDAPDAETVYQAFDDAGQLAPLVAAMTPYDGTEAFYTPVFGERDTRTVDLTLRSDITFSPTLSLQFYGQLFAARGTYLNFSLLQDRDTLAPLPTYPKNHDFAFSSFQTNTVLRWEYRPGSSLYLVWSQSRRGSSDVDPFHPGPSPFDQNSLNQLTDTFDVFPTNVFLVKLSYKFLS